MDGGASGGGRDSNDNNDDDNNNDTTVRYHSNANTTYDTLGTKIFSIATDLGNNSASPMLIPIRLNGTTETTALADTGCPLPLVIPTAVYEKIPAFCRPRLQQDQLQLTGAFDNNATSTITTNGFAYLDVAIHATLQARTTTGMSHGRFYSDELEGEQRLKVYVVDKLGQVLLGRPALLPHKDADHGEGDVPLLAELMAALLDPAFDVGYVPFGPPRRPITAPLSLSAVSNTATLCEVVAEPHDTGTNPIDDMYDAVLHDTNTTPTRAEFDAMADTKLPDGLQQHKGRLLDMLMRQKAAFGPPGKDKMTPVQIQAFRTGPGITILDGETRTVPARYRQPVTDQIHKLQQHGQVAECERHEIRNVIPLVVVAKTDGTVRITQDLTRFNQIVAERAQGEVPVDITDTANPFHGQYLFSNFDLAAFFHATWLHESSHHLFGFKHDGRYYKYLVLPQGLHNSPGITKGLLHRHVLAPLARYATAIARQHNVPEGVAHFYVDDGSLGTPRLDTEENSVIYHLQLLEFLLELVHTNGYRVKAGKNSFLQYEAKTLGLIFNGETVRPDPDRFSALVHMAIPTPQTITIRAARTILGRLNHMVRWVHSPDYTRLQFIEDMQLISDAITAANAEGGPNISTLWTEAHIAAIKRAQQGILRSNTYFIPDPRRNLYIRADAATTGWGSHVFQYDINGRQRTTAWFGGRWPVQIQDLGVKDIELLAVVLTVRKLGPSALHYTIVYQTDHKNNLQMNTSSAPMIRRWYRELVQYQILVTHISGDRNYIADGISRDATEVDPSTPDLLPAHLKLLAITVRNADFKYNIGDTVYLERGTTAYTIVSRAVEDGVNVYVVQTDNPRWRDIHKSFEHDLVAIGATRTRRATGTGDGARGELTVHATDIRRDIMGRRQRAAGKPVAILVDAVPTTVQAAPTVTTTQESPVGYMSNDNPWLSSLLEMQGEFTTDEISTMERDAHYTKATIDKAGHRSLWRYDNKIVLPKAAVLTKALLLHEARLIGCTRGGQGDARQTVPVLLALHRRRRRERVPELHGLRSCKSTTRPGTDGQHQHVYV